MSVVNYAFMLPTDVVATDANVGLYDGTFCWVSGRPGYTGAVPLTNAPINPGTSAAQTIWKDGMVLKGKMGQPTYRVDLDELGSYGNMSDLTLEVKNMAGFIHTIRMAGIYLYRRPAYFFAIEDNVFYPWWTGVVDTHPYDERAFRIRCVDAWKDIHRQFPHELVTRENYPQAKDESVGKAIPVAFGNVTKAQLLQVSGDPSPLAAYKVLSTEYHVTVVEGAVTNFGLTLPLKTGSLSIQANQWAGLHLVIMKGGGERQYRNIVSNLLSASGITSVTIDSAFKGTIVGWSIGESSKGVWYFELRDFSNTRIFSQNPIYSIENSPITGNPLLERWDSEIPGYVDFSIVGPEKDLVNIDGTGHPGIKIHAKDPNSITGDFSAFIFVQPTAIQYVSRSISGMSVGIAETASTNYPSGAGTAIPELRDKDPLTRKIFTGEKTEPSLGRAISKIAVDVGMPSLAFTSGFRSLYLALDQEFTCSIAGDTEVFVTLKGKDFLGRNTVIFNRTRLYAAPDTAAIALSAGITHISSIIPDLYYGRKGDDTLFYSKRAYLDVSSILEDFKSSIAYPNIQIEIEVRWPLSIFAYTVEHAIREMTFVGLKTLQTINDRLYAKIQGETFGASWLARKTGTDPILNIIDAAEGIFWADNYDQAEPAPLNTASFDTAFTQRPTAQWTIGRQVTESKNSLEYLQELCRHGHFCIVPAPNGDRRILCWTENGTPIIAFNADNIKKGTLSILEETALRLCSNEFELNYDYDPGPARYKRTVFVRRVDQASFPASNQLEGTTSILSITSYTRYASFGAIEFILSAGTVKAGEYITLSGGANGFAFTAVRILALTGSGFIILDSLSGEYNMLLDATPYSAGSLVKHNSKVFTWTTYVGGMSNYTNASSIWNTCHNAWLITNTRHTLKLDLPWFTSMADWGGSADNDGPVSLLTKLVGWVTKPNQQVSFRIPVTAAHLALYVGGTVTFADEKLTNGAVRLSWITSLSLLTATDEIEVELISFPWG